MAQRALNVLFVCEKNSVRSVLAEALLNRFSDGRFQAFSAGLEPDTELHPLTVEILRAGGLAASSMKPRSVHEFATPAAPRMDFVICMGKNMAPAVRGLPGNPMRAEWGISDPAKSEGGEALPPKLAFRRAFRELENRIRLFVLVRHHREPERSTYTTA
jgi:protein-tyrosine-phosphatase